MAICQIAKDFGCGRTFQGEDCISFPIEGVALYNRRGFCPLSGKGPKAPIKKEPEKKRVGQQKSQKKK